MQPPTSLKPAGPNAMRPANRGLRFLELSNPRQVLVRLCQSVNFGQIRGLEVRDSDPVFCPPPEVLVDVKLDSDEVPRPEISVADFMLPAEVCRLLDRLDELITTTIECLEVRAGIPRRVVFRAAMEKGLSKPSRLAAGDRRDGDLSPLHKEGCMMAADISRTSCNLS